MSSNIPRAEEELMSNWKGKTIPLVSICCITYNHENYIAKTLDSFLMQKTDFPFEILIHDDASTDNTATIIREYESKFPNIIKPIYQTENQKSKFGGGMNPRFNYPRAEGKYIALCEGDDYWTDLLKLQKQVDFLEGNMDCSLCFHASKHIWINNLKKFKIQRPQKIPNDNKFETKDVILRGSGIKTTNTVVFLKKHVQKMPAWTKDATSGDVVLTYLLAAKGKFGYLDEVMSVYRRGIVGSWSNTMKDNRMFAEHYKKTLQMLRNFDEWTGGKYRRIVLKKILNTRIMYYKVIIKRYL